MNALLTRGKDAFDALSIREQWMIALAGWIAILGLGLFLFIEPVSKTLAQLEAQILQSERTTEDLVTLNRLKQEKLHTSPNTELEAELAYSTKRFQRLIVKWSARWTVWLPLPKCLH